MNLVHQSKVSLQGSWRLVSYEVEAQASGQIFTPMGLRPSGYTMFSPQGRVWFMLTAEGRQPGDTAEAQSNLLDTMVAYSGRYRLEGSDWITSVDVAWDPAWVGTEQRRGFEVVGDRLRVLTPWRVMPNWAEHGLTRSIVTFQRDPQA